jgi:hypothetical protein
MNITGASLTSLNRVAINPQPLPPGGDPYSAASLFDKVALNPQPLPPGPDPYSPASQLDKVALNPQPLPPGDLEMVTKAGIIIIGGKQLSLDDDNFCGNGQLPVHPTPRPDWSFNTALPNQQLLQGAVQFF